MNSQAIDRAETLPLMLEASAARHGDREALVQGQDRWTYDELVADVRRLANALLENGVQVGDRIGVWLPNYPEWVIANFAIASVGAITVPVNTRFRAEEVKHVLESAGVSVLVMTDAFMTNRYFDILQEVVPEVRDTRDGVVRSSLLPHLRLVIGVRMSNPAVLSWRDLLEAHPAEASPELRRRIDLTTADDPVNMFWTSGTTAKPKGAVNSHRVIENLANYSDILKIGPEDRSLVSTPLFYTTGNYWSMLVAILNGACVLLLLELTPEEALQTIDEEGATLMVGIPNAYIKLLNHPTFPERSMESLRVAWAGGATLPVELVLQIQEELGVEVLFQVYGMTETGGITTLTPPDAAPELIAESIGRPLPNFELRIVDPESLEDVGPGGDGELWVRSPYLLKTYWGMPEDQLANYFPEGGWYRTGDVVSRDEDDNYFFRGRIKDMIKVGGENVAAREVELALFAHPDVVQVAVLGVPDPVRNEAVVAVVETRSSLDPEALRAWCRERLAPFKVPRHFVSCTDWPTTATGKIQKFALRDDVLRRIDVPA